MELFFVLLLVATMAGALAMGFPVAFALPGSAILTIAIAALTGQLFAGDVSAFFHQDGPVQWLSAGVTNFRGIYWEVERDTLIAIPLFVFMGIMLQRSRIAEDLLVTMAQLFGPVPGGLGVSVVLVGALLAATTGIVGATVVAMGLISLPAMLRNSYSRPLATGTICASGTLGQIIPPSIVLIILADQLSSASDQAASLRKAEYKDATGNSLMPSEFDISSTSAGDMFLGAFLPGLVLVGLYVAYIFGTALLRPALAPPVAYEGRYDRRFAVKVVMALVPPLTLILAVLGSIILGIATVNQAGAIGAVGATIMAGYRLMEGQPGAFRPALLAVASVAAVMALLAAFDINVKSARTVGDLAVLAMAAAASGGLVAAFVWSAWRVFRIEDTLRGVMLETAKTTSMVFIILLGAAMLTAAFRSFGGEEMVREFLTSLPGGFWTQMIVVMAVIFLLGFFLDFIEIAVVVVPIIAPILLADPSANVTAVWLGVMIGVNIQTSFLTPPFGFALFYLRGVASKAVRTLEMYRGVVAFIALQLLALGIVGLYPPLVNYLPYRASLLADTAPPPINPRLQRCIEEDMFPELLARRTSLQAAIDRAGDVELGFLPANRWRGYTEGLAMAERAFTLVEEAIDADRRLAAYVPYYRPLHRQVRRIEAEIRAVDEEIKELNSALRRLERANAGETMEVEELRSEVERQEERKRSLVAIIPAEWEEARRRYQELDKVAAAARVAYRRSADGAYGAVTEMIELATTGPLLASTVGRYGDLESRARRGEDVADDLRALERDLRSVAGTSEIRSQLTAARRHISRGRPPEDAAPMIGEAASLHETELAWRSRVSETLSETLATYEREIRDTLGLRKQPRLPRPLAKSVAACLSGHRDISLSF